MPSTQPWCCLLGRNLSQARWLLVIEVWIVSGARAVVAAGVGGPPFSDRVGG
ncbi:hypothetical protein [Nocardia sp. NPDC050793]|uniref:hypothetical protein n=1 Tax=Nocardia sp. NPDC050793 TaxID=3155159 RepID=UPI003407699D